MVTLSIVQSMMMIIPVAAFSVNMYQTLKGRLAALRDSPTLRFVGIGGLMYAASSVQGSLEALRSVNLVAHFTHYTVGHAHLGLYGFVSFVFFFPDDPARAFVGGILATLAPWLVYRGARSVYAFDGSLRNLTPGRLLVLALVYSVASPLLHHLWFALRGQDDLVRGFVVMFAGDLAGTLIVLYGIKGLLALLAPAR